MNSRVSLIKKQHAGLKAGWKSASLLLFFLSSGFISRSQAIDYFSLRTDHADTIFYPFYDDVQMIELEKRAVRFSGGENQYLWQASVFLFRNNHGKIIQVYNSRMSLEELNNQFLSVPVTRYKNGEGKAQATTHSKEFSKSLVKGNSPAKGYYKIFDPNNRLVLLIDSLGKQPSLSTYIVLDPLYDGNILATSLWGHSIINPQGKKLSNAIQSRPIYFSPDSPAFDEKNTASAKSIYFIREMRLLTLPDYSQIEDYNFNKKNSHYIAVYKNKRWGFIDFYGNTVVPCIYDVYDYPNTHIGLSRVLRNGKWGYIDKWAKELIPCIYHEAYPFTENGLARVSMGKKSFCINQFGQKMKGCQMDANWECTDSNTYWGGKIVIQKAEDKYMYGIANARNGELIIPFLYNHIEKKPAESFFRLRADGELLLDSNFKKSSPAGFDWIGSFNQGYAIVAKNRQLGVINEQYKLVIPCKYNNLSTIAPGRFYFQSADEKGLLTIKGQKFLLKNYDEIGPFINKYARVYKGLYCGFIDMNGHEVIPCRFRKEEIGHKIHFNRLWFRKNDKFGYMNAQAKVVIAAEYDQATAFTIGIAQVENSEGKWLIDTLGKRINKVGLEQLDYSADDSIFYGTTAEEQQLIFSTKGALLCSLELSDDIVEINQGENYILLKSDDEQHYLINIGTNQKTALPGDIQDQKFENGRIRFIKDGLYGYFDLQGQMLIPPIYQAAHPFKQKVTAVQKDGKWFLIDIHGKSCSKFKYDDLSAGWENNALMIATRDDHYGLIDTSGQERIPCVYDDLEWHQYPIIPTLDKEYFDFSDQEWISLDARLGEDSFWLDINGKNKTGYFYPFRLDPVK